MKKKEKGKRNWIRTNYSLSWKFLKESKNYILFAFLIFLVFSFIGLAFPVFFIDAIKKMLEQIFAQTANLNTQELIVFIINNNLKSSFIGLIFGLFFGIIPIFLLVINGYILGFVANLSVSAGGFGILWRLFPHGIFEFPAIIISLGIGIKLYFSLFSRNKKDNNSVIVFSFLTSAIFIFCLLIGAGIAYNYTKDTTSEFFSYFLSISAIIGYILGLIFGSRFLTKNVKEKLRYNIENSLRVFLFIVLPLLILAGIIEGVLIFLLS